MWKKPAGHYLRSSVGHQSSFYQHPPFTAGEILIITLSPVLSDAPFITASSVLSGLCSHSKIFQMELKGINLIMIF